MLKFTIIACINQKRVIGKNGKLLYRIGNDINNFANMTKYNGVVIMGRKTFETLPNGEPLKDRVNIIVSSNTEYAIKEHSNAYIVNSVKDAIELCEAFFEDKELFVIGGGEIYKAFIESGLVDEMRLTIVDGNDEGDTFFPQYDESEWVTYFETLPMNDGTNTFIYKVIKKK